MRNYQEWAGPTDWRNPDTDGDGLLDGEEVEQYGSNPVSVDSSGDGINDKKAVSVNLDPTEKYPLMNRAIENEFSKNVIQSLANLNNFDLNSKNTAFLEELSRLPKEERFPFFDSITEDGKIDLGEKQQIKYLLELPQEKHSELVGKELIYELNIDNDFGSNWFESNISKTNPFSPNERYALLVDSAHESREEVNSLHKKLKNIGLPENHIFELVGDEATYEGLDSTVEEIGSIDRKSDQLFINIQGHGGGGFSLKGGGIRYSELDGLLDEVDSTIVLTNESCHSGASLPPLSQDWTEASGKPSPRKFIA
ncbi:hypothetical protein AKJ66_01100 [candidate division MSBL1 archaeon SCGC-AAA259E22]|uniref:EF-hand domain-containing protein n=1 Tax=candidate division MSBL1 archaeon SCGC-AAA259E22 TaxID=1698265 RepID=A0A133UHS4_9EURY|nr:hypothetical protein AKJ66_01100 [candidate division MSBL1 archaeon SCGC-AAA259E22]